MDPFTNELWHSIEDDIFPAIIGHPFLQGLTDGKLEEACFQYYVAQDSAYLESYGRGLALLAARAEESGPFMMFCEHARTTVIVEEALHREFLGTWGDAVQPPEWHSMSPNGLLYTSYLMRVAWERPWYEGVAAFLPCYWIYRRVGEHLVSSGSPHPLYQKWIDTYSGEEFGAVVREILQLVDRLAAPLGNGERRRMKEHFRRTSQLEYLFWDAAYHRQEWPLTIPHT